MKKWIQKQIKGIKTYYARDGLKGVLYYIKHRFYNRLIKPVLHADFWIPFSAERRLAKRFEATFPKVDNTHFLTMGNYVIYDDKSLSNESVVYSLGVLANTDFDQAVADKYLCPIYLFDPSNIARDHLQKVNNPLFKFQQIGVWNETVEMNFKTPKYGGSPSMIASHDGKQFVHQCVDIKSVLAEHQHDRIDILKMDIEGAAFAILERLLEIEVYPKQIIAEFERMNRDDVMNFFNFYTRLIHLNNQLKNLGYKAYVIPRDKYKYFSIELIFVRHV
ncbi:FkbM family methyltransferase [Alteromonas sp. a30]|uniref:FkbM family methyltransferase n=1 Tax=Alteromonas sp. a30 TaxID=2730917 RepID=UPI0022806A2E|nr:FkbM family methyltransferase [Alteromonas sp. a30]MCY7296210.1 FkbM family methyltransferase [Alteromonas sp. a30]